jgi:hypothetical protein
MAGSHLSTIGYASRTDERPARPAPNRQGRRLATGIAVATGLALAVVPVAVMAVLPGAPAQAVVSTKPVETLVPSQGLAIDPAIMAFSQDGATIKLSLMAADDGQRVYVEDAANNIIEIPVSPGQTNVTAELPDTFVASDTLTIRVH